MYYDQYTCNTQYPTQAHVGNSILHPFINYSPTQFELGFGAENIELLVEQWKKHVFHNGMQGRE